MMPYTALGAVLLSGLCLMPKASFADAPGAETRARAAMHAGDAETSIAHWKEAVSAAPDNLNLRRRLAEAYLAAGNIRWALRTLTEIQRAVPEACEHQRHLQRE